jgi:hypothetical protein
LRCRDHIWTQLQIESGWSDAEKRAATAFLLRHGIVEILRRPGGKDVVVVRRFVETS